MRTATESGIRCKPGMCGGKPVIAGTRITVKHIVELHINGGVSVEEIMESLPHLTPAQIYDALAYYHRHQDEIDKDMVEDDKIIRKMARKFRLPLKS